MQKGMRKLVKVIMRKEGVVLLCLTKQGKEGNNLISICRAREEAMVSNIDINGKLQRGCRFINKLRKTK